MATPVVRCARCRNPLSGQVDERGNVSCLKCNLSQWVSLKDRHLLQPLLPNIFGGGR